MPADAVYYEVATQRLEEQMARIDKLDTKVATVFGFAAAILPLFGALVAIFESEPPDASSYLYVAAFLVYLILMVVAGRAYMIANWRLDPDLEELRAYSQDYEDAAMRIWVANECVNAINANEPQLRDKATTVGVAVVLLAVDVLLLSLAAAIAIL